LTDVFGTAARDVIKLQNHHPIFGGRNSTKTGNAIKRFPDGFVWQDGKCFAYGYASLNRRCASYAGLKMQSNHTRPNRILVCKGAFAVLSGEIK
jgi:hypothetical protein